MATVDMMNNLNDIMNLYQQFMQNPMQMLSRKFNIPQNINNPNDVVQHLLTTGQITQSQLNNAINMRNNPLIQKLMGGR